jgi:glycosyltransferase involved in cell wall biosynthesis
MLTDLALDIAETSQKVVVITSRQRYDDPSAELPSHEEVGGIDIHRVRAPRFGRGNLLGRSLDYLGFYISASIRLWQLCHAGDTVIAKTDPPLISVPAAWIARKKGARLVNWLQDLFPEVAIALGVRGFAGHMGRWLRWTRNWSLHQAEMNVAIGELMATRLLAQGIPGDKLVVIPNWADGAAIRPVLPEQNSLRREWGLDGKFVVGYSGNLGRAHEFDTIMGAAETLKDHPHIVFLFIGGGKHWEAVRRETEGRGLENVRFHPYQSRKQLHLSLGAADVHLVVLRPEFEGLVVPSKIYGCMAAGRPVIFIGDPEGELSRLINAHQFGVSCPTGDYRRLAASILRVSKHSAASVMGARARRYFEEHYDMHLSLSKLAALMGVAASNTSPKAL